MAVDATATAALVHLHHGADFSRRRRSGTVMAGTFTTGDHSGSTGIGGGASGEK